MKYSKEITKKAPEKITHNSNIRSNQKGNNLNNQKRQIQSASINPNKNKRMKEDTKNISNSSFKLEENKKKNQTKYIIKTDANKNNQTKKEIKTNPPSSQEQKVEPPQPQQSNIITTKEKPPKIEFDSKTIKSFMPYFEKTMTYTKRLAKNEIKVIMLYDKKIDELINIYTFTEKYLFFITQTFKKLCHPFYYILSITYLKDIKPYFAYFKNLVTIFETFSENLKNLGHSIKHSSTEDEYSNMNELMNVEFDLNKSVEKLNLIYADIFSIISTNLKENVLNKPLYNKVETVEPKFWENAKNMEKLVSKLEHRREKLINKYKKEYEQLFIYYKNKKQKEDKELFNDLVCMKDFLFIEYELISYCNKAFVKIRKFLKDIEILLNNSIN